MSYYYYYCTVLLLGRKSEYPLSPAYTLFSFTPSPKKRIAEQGLERYEVAKRRRQEKERIEAADALEALASTTDDVHYPPDMVTVGTQTTLTVADVTALEEDNQKRIAELAEVHVAKGYPSQEDFKGSEKVLRFYTGISSFTVLMALLTLGAHAQRGLL